MQVRRAGPTPAYSPASEAPPHGQTRSNPIGQALQATHSIGARRTIVSGPCHDRDVLGRSVHLLAADQAFQRGLRADTFAAVCGEVLTSAPGSGEDPIIGWREADYGEGGRVVKRVVLTLDATMNTATVLTTAEATELGTRSWRMFGYRRPAIPARWR